MIDLKEVITKYPESLESAARFRAYLTDLYPERADQVRIKVLADVISCGIVDEIKAGNTDSLSISRYRKLMEDRYGYSALLVSESIRMWVQTYAPVNETAPQKQVKVVRQAQVVTDGKIHIHRFEEFTVKATCREHGYTLHRCKCGYSHRDKFTPVGDHRFEVVDEIAPTCIEEGRRDYICSVCSEYKSETIPKTTHRFSAWKTVQKAGCGVEGRKERHCATCAKIETETIPALQHDWTDWTDNVFATCTENGKRIRQCKRCKEMEERTTPAAGHSFSQWKDSATQDGMMERFCENCGQVEYKETISKLRKEQQTLANEIENREAYLGTLGLFKRKEKEATEKDISTLEAKLSTVIARIIKEYGSEESFFFGRYEQGSGVKPIEWIVLAVEGSRALLISKYALDYCTFYSSGNGWRWKTCEVRHWLNDIFLFDAFRVEERKRILTVGNSYDKNYYFSNTGKNIIIDVGTVRDKIFLLSTEEVERYFHSEASRKCYPTAYAVKEGAERGSEGNCWWLLRSVGSVFEGAVTVRVDGSFDSMGRSAISRDAVGRLIEVYRGCVRPALWINLDV